MEGKWDFAPPSLKESVDRFEWYAAHESRIGLGDDANNYSHRLLLSIRDWMRDLARTNLFTRFIKKDRIRDKITDFELQLIDAVSQFQVCFDVFVNTLMSCMVPVHRAR